MTTNNQRIYQAFEVLTPSLARYVARELRNRFSNDWWDRGVLEVLYEPQRRNLPAAGTDSELIVSLDAHRCLLLINIQWGSVFGRKLNPEHRAWVNELIAVRNRTMHAGHADTSDDAAWRALDTMIRLLERIDPRAADRVRGLLRTSGVGSTEPAPPIGAAGTKNESPPPKRRHSVRGKTTVPGYCNRNNQVVVRETDVPGNDHNQYVYVLRCANCGHEYGANGSDVWQRRCPTCDGGAPGLAY